MYPVSDEFRAAIRSSHVAPVTAEVWSGGSKVLDVYPTSGSVSIDARRSVRRTCSLTLVDPDGTLTPDDAFDALAPFGNELRLARGVKFADGSREMVPLGSFVITDVDIRDSGSGLTIDVNGQDRSLRIARNRLRDPYTIARNTTLEDAIAGLLRDRWADAPIGFDATGKTTGRITIEAGAESDPWRSAVEIAEAHGFDLYFDGDGIARLTQYPDPTGTSPVEIYEDGTDAVLLEVSRALSNEQTYNGVIATGESTEATVPVRAEVWDEDPNSATFRYGPFGEVPMFYTSSLITTLNQAQDTALSLLQTKLGATEAIEWTQIVNPAHDAYDVVRLVRPTAKVDATLVIDSVTIPLTAEGTMSGVARVRRI